MTRFSDLLGGGPDVAAEALPTDDPNTLEASSPIGTIGTIGNDVPALPPASDQPARPSAAPSRDVFSELADEQSVHAEREDEVTARLRSMGLDSLPVVEDDFLPGR